MIPHHPDYVLVPIAIRQGETVRVHFPADITAEEAAKVGRVILAYAESDRDRDPEGDETRSGSVERSEIEPGPKASPKSHPEHPQHNQE